MSWADLMHDLYLGQGRDFGASVLIDLVEHQHIVDHLGAPFQSKEVALKVISMEMKAPARVVTTSDLISHSWPRVWFGTSREKS